MEGRRGWIEPAVGGRVKLCKGEEEHGLVKSNLCSEAGEGGTEGSRGDDALGCGIRGCDEGEERR